MPRAKKLSLVKKYNSRAKRPSNHQDIDNENAKNSQSADECDLSTLIESDIFLEDPLCLCNGHLHDMMSNEIPVNVLGKWFSKFLLCSKSVSVELGPGAVGNYLSKLN
jgi:hypothetical protein